MLRNPVTDFPGEVQPPAIVLEDVHDAQALLVMLEPAGDERLQHALARVAERRVPEIVPECDRLRQLFVQPQHLGDAARDLRDLEGMRESRAIVIAFRREKDLRLVLQAAERFAVDDSVPIALERGPDRIFRLGTQPSAGAIALGGLRRENLVLALLELFANRHLCDQYLPEKARPVCQRANTEDFGN